jgi:hypothetical protein
MTLSQQIALPTLFAASLLAARIAPSISIIVYFTITLYALIGYKHAIHALAIAWLLPLINTGIGLDQSTAALGKYLILSAAFLGTIARATLQKHSTNAAKSLLYTILLTTILILHSIAFSTEKAISILKILSWSVTICTIITAFNTLNSQEKNILEKNLFAGLSAIGIASIPLIFFELGYTTNGTGFQGILNHPQAFGITMALLAAWNLGKILENKILKWGPTFGLTMCLLGMYASEARTAVLALLIGTVLTYIINATKSGRKRTTTFPILSNNKAKIFLVFLTVIAIFSYANPNGILNDFLKKSGRSEATGIFTAYEGSRGVLILPMLANIQANPFQGIGFGVGSVSELTEIKRDPILGMPISAPTEKGVLPLAVLEETGIFGFILIAAWIIYIVNLSQQAGLRHLLVTSTILSLNLGESTFFSIGGIGLFSIILLGWAISKNYEPINK